MTGNTSRLSIQSRRLALCTLICDIVDALPLFDQPQERYRCPWYHATVSVLKEGMLPYRKITAAELEQCLDDLGSVNRPLPGAPAKRLLSRGDVTSLKGVPAPAPVQAELTKLANLIGSLTVNTIHSAKGCAWDVVYVIHVSDGILPSDMATGDADQIEGGADTFPCAAMAPQSYHSAPMETHAFGLRLPANALEGHKRFLSVRSSALAVSGFMAPCLS